LDGEESPLTQPPNPNPITAIQNLPIQLWLFAAFVDQQFTTLYQQIGTLMAQVAVEQTALDDLATALEAVKTTLANEITKLEAQVTAGTLPAGSLTGLNQALTDLQAIPLP
jgi:hypothetical protein